MKPAPGIDILFLSSLPAECAPHLSMLQAQGMNVRVASRPDRALELLRLRPGLVLVDLVHGPGLSPSVVTVLNRKPRPARVVALHDGRIDTWLDQVEHLIIDGLCRLAAGAESGCIAD